MAMAMAITTTERAVNPSIPDEAGMAPPPQW
jgi:hypothetical protein